MSDLIVLLRNGGPFDALQVMEQAATEIESQAKRIAALEALSDSQSLLLGHAQNALKELEAEVAALRVDAGRLDYLQANFLCADFEYEIGEGAITALVFGWPSGSPASNNLRSTIDAAKEQQ